MPKLPLPPYAPPSRKDFHSDHEHRNAVGRYIRDWKASVDACVGIDYECEWLEMLKPARVEIDEYGNRVAYPPVWGGFEVRRVTKAQAEAWKKAALGQNV